MQWRYAARLAQHFATDLVWAPLSETRSSGQPQRILPAITTMPVRRVAEALYYKLRGAGQGRGRPIPQSTWDYEYEHGRWTELDSFDAVAANMVIVGYLHRLFERPNVLDMGCGSGTLADFIQLLPGSSYTGVDLSDAAVSHATARGFPNARFVQASMENWVPSEQYDSIIFNQSIYYTREPSAVLQRYSPWLTERGICVVTMLQRGNSQTMWDGIAREFATMTSATILQSNDAPTDIRVLRPRARQSSAAVTVAHGASAPRRPIRS